MDISHTIDYAVVEELYQMGGPSLMVQLFDLYREDVDRLRRELDHAQARNDAAEVARAAHAMSGCSASVGARTLAAAAKRLKLRAITGTLEECELLLADVVAESQRAISALEGVAKGLYPV
jgi:HPt (histidine-containing phosphotransfer) domain-containing protein